jgi:pSer/pThr/pTyr-binding forkhead associated (FHA) protein
MAKGSTPPPFTFRIVAGPLEGKELYKEGKKFRVGRTKASSIQIKDPAVSEKHAEIVFADGEWRVRDLGSSNGTQLNGVEVQGKDRC